MTGRSFIITPNLFEAGQLLDCEIKSEEDAMLAMFRLASLGPKIVALTSAEFMSIPSLPDQPVPVSDLICCYLLDMTATNRVATITKIVVPKLPGDSSPEALFVCVEDLLHSACAFTHVLGWYLISPLISSVVGLQVISRVQETSPQPYYSPGSTG